MLPEAGVLAGCALAIVLAAAPAGATGAVRGRRGGIEITDLAK